MKTTIERQKRSTFNKVCLIVAIVSVISYGYMRLTNKESTKLLEVILGTSCILVLLTGPSLGSIIVTVNTSEDIDKNLKQAVRKEFRSN